MTHLVTPACPQQPLLSSITDGDEPLKEHSGLSAVPEGGGAWHRFSLGSMYPCVMLLPLRPCSIRNTLYHFCFECSCSCVQGQLSVPHLQGDYLLVIDAATSTGELALNRSLLNGRLPQCISPYSPSHLPILHNVYTVSLSCSGVIYTSSPTLSVYKVKLYSI